MAQLPLLCAQQLVHEARAVAHLLVLQLYVVHLAVLPLLWQRVWRHRPGLFGSRALAATVSGSVTQMPAGSWRQRLSAMPAVGRHRLHSVATGGRRGVTRSGGPALAPIAAAEAPSYALLAPEPATRNLHYMLSHQARASPVHVQRPAQRVSSCLPPLSRPPYGHTVCQQTPACVVNACLCS